MCVCGGGDGGDNMTLSIPTMWLFPDLCLTFLPQPSHRQTCIFFIFMVLAVLNLLLQICFYFIYERGPHVIPFWGNHVICKTML